jgi:hypothetical protein
VRVAAGRFDLTEPRGFAWAQFDLEGVDDPPRDFVKDVAQVAIEAVGPKVSAGLPRPLGGCCPRAPSGRRARGRPCGCRPPALPL